MRENLLLGMKSTRRAGRWALDARYAAMLLDEGYRVDCSVTPGVDWCANPGDPAGAGGSDYSSFPHRPYLLAPPDISRPSAAGLLEVPMTVLPGRLFRSSPWAYRVPGLSRIASRISPARRWLCPVALLEKRNLDAMVELARRSRHERPTHLEFTLHSSELMPGGSPSFQSTADVERLYASLEVLFQVLAGWCRSFTLAEFREHWLAAERRAAA